MANTRQAIEKLTRYVYQAVKRLDSVSRSEQLPSTSVVLEDGSEHGIVDGIENASDANTGLGILDDNLYDLDENSDATLEDYVVMPERMHPYSGDVAFEFGLVVSDRVNAAQAKADQTASDLLQVAQDAADATTKANQAIAGSVVEYAVSASPTTAPSSGWSIETPEWADGTWVWTRTTIVRGNGDTETGDPVVLTGPAGVPGSPGSPGAPGAPGVGISDTQIRYQSSTSGTVEPSGSWLSSIPVVAEGHYLWTRTRITYSDSSTSTAFSVALMGKEGSPGTPGDPGSPGSDGKGISSTVITYQGHSSGTLPAPTGSWVSSIPVVPAGDFLWTRTVITYTDSTTSVAYAIARMGADGTPGVPGSPGSDGRGVSSTEVAYQAGASGTAAPTGSWTTSVPAVASGQYLWTRTTTNYTSGSPTVAYSVGRIGENGTPGSPGSPGADGRGVTGAVTAYQSSASGTVVPTGSWVSNPPAVPEGNFLWTRVVTSYTEGAATTAYSVAKQGQKGDQGNPGAQGVSVSTLTRFYWLGASQPAVPTASPPPAPWMTTEPAYSPGSSANLYEVTRTVLSNGSWSYGPVSVSASFSAAKQAYNLANTTKFLAEGLYQPIPSVAPPTTSPTGALKAGDQWWKIDPVDASKWVGVAVWNGSAWQDRQMIANSLLVPGSVGAVLIEDGGITAPKLSVDALDFRVARGMQIIGGSFELDTIVDMTTEYSNNCTSAAGWIDKGGTPLTRNTSQFHSSPSSINSKLLSGVHHAGLNMSLVPSTDEAILRFWVRHTAGVMPMNPTVTIGQFSNMDTAYKIPQGFTAGVWTQVEVPFYMNGSAITYILYENTQSAFQIDDVEIITGSWSEDKVAIKRLPNGDSVIQSSNANGLVSTLTKGGLQLEYKNPSMPSSQYLVQHSTGGVYVASTGATGYTIEIGQGRGDTISLIADNINLDAISVSYRGDMPWTNVTMRSGYQARSGQPIQIAKFNGVVYLRGTVDTSIGTWSGGTYPFVVPSWATPSAEVALPAYSGATYDAWINTSGQVFMGSGSISNRPLWWKVQSQWVQ